MLKSTIVGIENQSYMDDAEPDLPLEQQSLHTHTQLYCWGINFTITHTHTSVTQL